MSRLLEISWWLSYLPTVLPWWFFCFLAALAALPLCLRLFRGMADRGAGLSVGFGLILTTYIAWLFGMGYTGQSGALRVLILAGALGLAGAAFWLQTKKKLGGPAEMTIFFPSIVLALTALFYLPHSFFSAWVALLLVACASIASWAHEPKELLKALRLVAVPFAVSQIIFLISLLFFTNVRSYIPYATFELSLWQAEKWGNFTHLSSVMTSSTMPPRDLWFNREPLNYYYGGHLLVGTIAKATFTDVRIAFNLGLATIFALTTTLGFSFSLSLVHLTTRRVVISKKIIWHHGMAWALFGALAIACFGNLDPWRQFFIRDPGQGDAHEQRRYEQLQRQEEWKLETGMSAQSALALLATVNQIPQFERPQALAKELQLLATGSGDAPAELQELANSIERMRAGATSAQALENQLSQLLNSPTAQNAFEKQNGVSKLELREELINALYGQDYEGMAETLREAAEKHQDNGVDFTALESQLSAKVDAALEHEELDDIRELLADEEMAPAFQQITNVLPQDALTNLRTAAEQDDFAETGRLLSAWWNNALNNQKQRNNQNRNLPIEQQRAQRQVRQELQEALRVFTFDPKEILVDEWGSRPPSREPVPSRFTWANFTKIDFWASSRAIKSSPPGVNEAGTITEFPYFSAILGDLHPHHMALPFTLLALSACLSLLRKNSRLRRTDIQFLKRSWPELVTMAFMIGMVFPVNIWDAVVLVPVYGVVIVVAVAGMRAGEGWRWIGFGGFVVLVSMICALIYNSIPGVVPLFGSFKAFLVAVGITLLPPVIFGLRKQLSERTLFVAALALGVIVVFIGGLVSPGIYEGAGIGAFGVGLRDAALFLIISLLAASWTLKGAPNTHRWWYAAGATFAFVGIISLFLILPFKLYFHSPLQPQGQILSELMPPIMSHELTGSQTGFWAAFWKGSPINPFPANIRSEVRDFIAHWGLFFLPILIFAIVRFFTASTRVARGIPFMILMLVVGVMALARNYLGYWVGPLSLGMIILSIYFAIVYRRHAESPAWALLAGAFFWTWFVEALHFDDDYAGKFERYNTPFKIFYPLWPIFAGGMVVALREMFARFRTPTYAPKEMFTRSEPWIFWIVMLVAVPWLLFTYVNDTVGNLWIVFSWGSFVVICAVGYWAINEKQPNVLQALSDETSRMISHWPAIVAVLFVGTLGMIYPIASTVTRTHNFFTTPKWNSGWMRSENRDIFRERTLDATAHFKEYSKYRQDYKMMNWIRENLPAGAFILELPGDHAYSSQGRVSTGSGHPTILGWRHHEQQWRGRAKPASAKLKNEYAYIYDDVFGNENMEAYANSFKLVYSSHEKVDEVLTREFLKTLRFADTKERKRLLRDSFPDAAESQIYRMLRIIETHDMTMDHVVGRMYRDGEEMYKSTDKERVRELMGRYGIEYVVVGQLEREAYEQPNSTTLSDKLNSWGFELVYDTSTELLPDENDSLGETEPLPEGESYDVAKPTQLYKVPDDFPIVESGGESDGEE